MSKLREILDDWTGRCYPGRQSRNVERLRVEAERAERIEDLLRYVHSKSIGLHRTIERDAVPVFLSQARLDEIASTLEGE